MVQLGAVVGNGESVKADDVFVIFRDEGLISFNVFWSDGERVFPVTNPVVRIAPVTLGFVRQFGEGGCFFRFRQTHFQHRGAYQTIRVFFANRSADRVPRWNHPRIQSATPSLTRRGSFVPSCPGSECSPFGWAELAERISTPSIYPVRS